MLIKMRLLLLECFFLDANYFVNLYLRFYLFALLFIDIMCLYLILLLYLVQAWNSILSWNGRFSVDSFSFGNIETERLYTDQFCINRTIFTSRRVN